MAVVSGKSHEASTLTALYCIHGPGIPPASTEECRFHVYARIAADGFVYLRKLQLDHSPFCLEKVRPSAVAIQQAALLFVGNFQNVSPRDIQNLVCSDYGVELPYHTTWKALARIRGEQNRADDRSFQLIGGFLQMFRQLNPGFH